MRLDHRALALCLALGVCAQQATAAETPAVPLPDPAKVSPAGAPPQGGTLPFPAGSTSVDPSRFGDKVPDDAFGAYQRGLYKTALNLALIAADKGDPAAQTLAAEIYAQGLGTGQNMKEAARLYGLASEKGIAEAEFQFALFKIEGKYVNSDRKGATALLEKAAATGHLLATFNLAQLKFKDAVTDADKKSAYDLYMKAANAGLADAQYAVSQFLANGTGGLPLDEPLARTWIEKAAIQGYDTAELDLATWLIEGIGGKRDYDAGFIWMKKAAEGGNVEAQRRLAHLYEDGIGTKGDLIAAAAWYVVAKRQGLKDDDLDDTLDGLTPDEMQKAIEQANRLR